MIAYLYNSAGEWICFKKGKYLYNTECEWIGWTPWDDFEVVDTNGNYLGTILKNRFYYFNNKPYRGHPRFIGYSPLPPYARDVVINK